MNRHLVTGGLAIAAIVLFAILNDRPGRMRSSSPAQDSVDTVTKPDAALANAEKRLAHGTQSAEFSVPSGSDQERSARRKSHPLADEIRAAVGKDGSVNTSTLELIKARMRYQPMDLIDAMLAEDDPTIVMMLALMLGENPDAMRDPRVIAALLALTEDSVYQKRQAALAALSFANEVTPELLERIGYLSREDSSNDVRISAIAAMSMWMSRYPQTIEPLTKALLAAAYATDDSAVRGHAIQLIANQEVAMLPEALEVMKEFLRTEPAAENRQLAALGVGGATGAARADAIATLESAFAREMNMDTKRVILMQLVRAGQGDAAEILKRLIVSDQIVQNDIRDYQELLAQGLTDPNDIWTQKSYRDAKRGTEVGMNHEEHHKHGQ